MDQGGGWWRRRNAAWTWTRPQAGGRESKHPDSCALTREAATGFPGAKRAVGTHGAWAGGCCSAGPCDSLSFGLREETRDPGQLPHKLEEFWRMEAPHCPLNARCNLGLGFGGFRTDTFLLEGRKHLHGHLTPPPPGFLSQTLMERRMQSQAAGRDCPRAEGPGGVPSLLSPLPLGA